MDCDPVSVSAQPFAEPWPERPAAKRHEREKNGAPQIRRDPVSPGQITCGAVARAARCEAAGAGNEAPLLLR